jgi:hypothetical protein
MGYAILEHLSYGPIIGNQDHAIDAIPKLGQLAGQNLAMLVCNDTTGKFRSNDE